MDKPDLTWLREEFRLLHDKLDDMRSHMSQLDVTQAEQAKDIAHHIKRTDALEHRVEQVAADLKPVKDHVTVLRGLIRILSITAVVLAIIAGAQKLLS